jgi:hypothetical protein
MLLFVMVSTKREFSVAWFSDGVSLEEQRNTVPKTALLQKPCFTLPVATSGCQGLAHFIPTTSIFQKNNSILCGKPRRHTPG